MYCEDYPCCGHTPADPCAPQWYDEPDAFDPRVNPHCFCDHEYGICEAENDYPDEEDEDFVENDDFPMYLEYTDWESDLPGAADVL